jgi:hypothetical protein
MINLHVDVVGEGRCHELHRYFPDRTCAAHRHLTNIIFAYHGCDSIYQFVAAARAASPADGPVKAIHIYGGSTYGADLSVEEAWAWLRGYCDALGLKKAIMAGHFGRQGRFDFHLMVVPIDADGRSVFRPGFNLEEVARCVAREMTTQLNYRRLVAGKLTIGNLDWLGQVYYESAPAPAVVLTDTVMVPTVQVPAAAEIAVPGPVDIPPGQPLPAPPAEVVPAPEVVPTSAAETEGSAPEENPPSVKSALPIGEAEEGEAAAAEDILPPPDQPLLVRLLEIPEDTVPSSAPPAETKPAAPIPETTLLPSFGEGPAGNSDAEDKARQKREQEEWEKKIARLEKQRQEDVARLDRYRLLLAGEIDLDSPAPDSWSFLLKPDDRAQVWAARPSAKEVFCRELVWAAELDTCSAARDAFLATAKRVLNEYETELLPPAETWAEKKVNHGWDR